MTHLAPLPGPQTEAAGCVLPPQQQRLKRGNNADPGTSTAHRAK